MTKNPNLKTCTYVTINIVYDFSFYITFYLIVEFRPITYIQTIKICNASQ